MAETLEQIMAATHDALAEVGYAGLSISKIAAHFEGSQSLIYYHYDDKEELLVAFLDHLLEGLNDELDAIDDLEPTDRIRATLELLLPVSSTDEPFRFHHALIEIRVQSPYHEPYEARFERLDDRIATVIETALAEACEAGTLDAADPEAAADRLLTEIYGVHYRNVPMEDVEGIRRSRARIERQLQTWEQSR
jgi:AcrR family transcriptional regulator